MSGPERVAEALMAEPGRYDLLQGLALVEALQHRAQYGQQMPQTFAHGDEALGEGLGPWDEGVEFVTEEGFGFVGRSLLGVERLREPPSERRAARELRRELVFNDLREHGDCTRWRVRVGIANLFGMGGPMPGVLGEQLLDHRSDGPQVFLDIFAARVVASYYRARKVGFPALGYLGRADGWLCNFLGAFGGHVEAIRERTHRRHRGGDVGEWGYYRRYAGLLAAASPSCEGLERLLDDSINGIELVGDLGRSWSRSRVQHLPNRRTVQPRGRKRGRHVQVRVSPAATRVAIDADSLTRIGRRRGQNNILGRGATLGRHYLEALGSVRVELEYGSWESFRASMLPELYPPVSPPVATLREIEAASAVYLGRRELARYFLRLRRGLLPEGRLYRRATLLAKKREYEEQARGERERVDELPPPLLLGYTSWLGRNRARTIEGAAQASPASPWAEVRIDAEPARRSLVPVEPSPKSLEPQAKESKDES